MVRYVRLLNTSSIENSITHVFHTVVNMDITWSKLVKISAAKIE